MRDLPTKLAISNIQRFETRKSLPCGLSLTIPYSLQQFLYFFPLPHGHGSLRPTFFSTILGLGGFSNRVKSEISSDLSGSNSILYFPPLSSNAPASSLNLLSVCTVTTAGFFSVPNFALFIPSKIRIRFPAPARLLIFPTSVILLPIAVLFQISLDLSIPRLELRYRHKQPIARRANRGGKLLVKAPWPSKSGGVDYEILRTGVSAALDLDKSAS